MAVGAKKVPIKFPKKGKAKKPAKKKVRINVKNMPAEAVRLTGGGNK